MGLNNVPGTTSIKIEKKKQRFYLSVFYSTVNSFGNGIKFGVFISETIYYNYVLCLWSYLNFAHDEAIF